MDMGYQTPWWAFVAMLAGYIVLSLALGGKGTYFEPYVEKSEESDAKATPQA